MSRVLIIMQCFPLAFRERFGRDNVIMSDINKPPMEVCASGNLEFISESTCLQTFDLSNGYNGILYLLGPLSWDKIIWTKGCRSMKLSDRRVHA